METIKDDAKRALTGLLNKSLQVEYDFIMNYPRMIDQIINYEGIRDEQLVKDLEILGKVSLRHFGEISKLVERLGGEPIWKIDVIARLEDVQELLIEQLAKEKEAASIYEDAKRIVVQNKVEVKTGGFLSKVIRIREELPQDIVSADDIIRLLDRQIWDERSHVKLVEDSIATLRALMKK